MPLAGELNWKTESKKAIQDTDQGREVWKWVWGEKKGIQYIGRMHLQ